MNKLIFVFIITLLLAGIALAVLFTNNLLPKPVYTFFYTQLPFSASRASYAYLEKYEGSWDTTFTPNQSQSDVATCVSGTGTLAIHNGALTGTLGSLNRYYSIRANVDENGALAGRLDKGQGDSGTLSGRMINGAGNGSWKDEFDCAGTFTMRKLDPVVDPVVARLISYSGLVSLGRGGKSESPSSNMTLYQGDVLHIPAGGSAYLSVGLGNSATINGPTDYTVGAPQ